MFIEVVNENQIDIVASLAKEIWTEHYTPIIGKDQVEYMLGRFQSKKAISSQIKDEGMILKWKNCLVMSVLNEY
jgi:diamine N-acetyltransferase